MACGEHDPRELSTPNLSANASRFAFRQFTRAIFTTRHPKSDQKSLCHDRNEKKILLLQNLYMGILVKQTPLPAVKTTG